MDRASKLEWIAGSCREGISIEFGGPSALFLEIPIVLAACHILNTPMRLVQNVARYCLYAYICYRDLVSC